MRAKRVKSFRKVMQLYQSAFGFREPYQLLADAAFVQACVQQKLDIYARLTDVLQGTVKPMITQCCMQILYDLGEEGQAAVDAAKDFERRKCNHFKTRPEAECMLAMAGKDNTNRYVFATQSLDLRIALRKIPGSPILYIARSVMLLETPSDQTVAKKAAMENAKLHVSAEELAQITGKPLPSSLPTPSPEPTSTTPGAPLEPPKKKRHRGPKGPNPLSVKKKKSDATGPTGRPSKRAREGESVGEGREAREEREGKRKREEESKVVSLATRPTPGAGGGGEGGGEGERKKRKRRKKGGAAAAVGGAGAAGGEAAAGGAEGGGGGDE